MEAPDDQDSESFERIPRISPGLFNLCEEFGRNCKSLSEQLERKTTENKKIVWNEEMIKSFEALKKALLENVILDIADPAKPYVLEVDASDYAIGGVLSQA